MPDNVESDKVTIAILDEKGIALHSTATNVSAVDAQGLAVGFDFAFPDRNTVWQVQVTAGSATSRDVIISQ